jgi:hypothetical protein
MVSGSLGDNAEQLRAAIEVQHGCKATWVQTERVVDTFAGETVWDGEVFVFQIHGHPKTHKAYAWSSSIEGSDKRRFFSVLHLPPVTSPLEAVRAAIVAEHRERKP